MDRWGWHYTERGLRVAGKTVAETRTEMVELVLPGDSNQLGNILGGKVMHWIDLAAAITAGRHAGHVAVTASMDSLEFLHPIKVGEVIRLIAQVNWVGRTSMEIGVEVFGENLETGEIRKTSTAYLTFVALNADGQPVEVPPLILTNAEEEARFRQAEARRAERLAKRAARKGQETP
ncbi:MAG: acyl-CoA thioesterase [Sulfobacillus sp.]|nr:acyl-CoA thioesterase [Sulfobacillus sp.]